MMRIVDRTDDLTPEWFTEVLRSGGTLGAQDSVASVDATVIGTGQVGFVVRAQLGYNGASAGPASLVVKLPSTDDGSRQMGAAMGIYESEVRFYQEIAPRLSAAIPAMHWGDVEPASGRFTLVIEDLLDSSDVGDTVVARFGDRVEPAHLELATRLAPNAAGSARRLWRAPWVVAHGDYRLDNMMFGRFDGAPPITVLDWQGARVGPPLLDVAVYLGSCMTVDERRAEEDRLLRLYHSGLLAAGVNDFSFSECRQSYRVSSLYPFLLTIAVSVTLHRTERGDQMWAQMFSNSAAIVADTGADALLG